MDYSNLSSEELDAEWHKYHLIQSEAHKEKEKIAKLQEAQRRTELLKTVEAEVAQFFPNVPIWDTRFPDPKHAGTEFVEMAAQLGGLQLIVKRFYQEWRVSTKDDKSCYRYNPFPTATLKEAFDDYCHYHNDSIQRAQKNLTEETRFPLARTTCSNDPSSYAHFEAFMNMDVQDALERLLWSQK